MIRVCFAGATGWAGSALARAMAATDDVEVVAAVSRTHAGKTLGEVLDEPHLTCPVFATTAEALTVPCDVFVEYTKPDAAKESILLALGKGANVVVGTSGLTDADYDEIGAAANAAGRAVLAVGNFSLTFALLEKFSEMAAKVIPQWEIIDYGPAKKKDAPSGTARELAWRLGQVREAQLKVPLDEVQGEVAARGARVTGTQVHSLRLDGLAYEVEITFGLPDQKLVLYHRAGSNADTYAEGGLIAIRNVGTFTGLKRGLDTVLNTDRM